MAKRKLTQDSVEYKIIIAIWEFWKNYGTPEDTDEYWEDVTKNKAITLARNEGFKEAWDLSTELFSAVLNVLDARQRSIKRFGDDKHGYEILLEDMKKINAR